MNRIEISGVLFQGEHPVMDNPHNRTASEVQGLVEAIGSSAASTGVKLMMLQQALNAPNKE